jgi:hypothetical protein
VIANSISVEYHEAITHLITIFIHICLPGRHYMYCYVKPFPKIPLISNSKTIISNITREFLLPMLLMTSQARPEAQPRIRALMNLPHRQMMHAVVML